MTDRIKGKYEYVIGTLFLILMLASFVHQKIYAVFAPFGTLVMFIGLVVVCVMLTLSDRDSFLKTDPVTAAGVAAVIITPINLLILGSGKGAMLIVFDQVLLLTMFIRGVGLSGRMKRICAFSGAAFMLLWYPVVRWDYGFNMVGFMFLILLVFGEILLEYIKNDMELWYLKYLQILFYITSVLLAVCYQARSAALSMAVFGIIYFIAPVIAQNRALYNAWIFVFTAGSLIFTGIYAAVADSGWNLRILYKDVMSGRELIWAELWREFIKHPVTGIGSSYEMKSFFMFEVHNALLDILVVHGIPVFICFLFLLVKALLRLRTRDIKFCPDKRLAFAGVFTLMFQSFFENGFIVTPYSMVFFILMLICVS